MPNDLIAITIKIETAEVMAALERLKNALKGGRLMQSIGEGVAMGSRDRIMGRENRAPDGTPWQPLAASTLKRKRAEGKGNMGILMFGPELARSIVPQDPTDDTVSIGSSLLYAMVHQEGADIAHKARAGTVRLRKVGGVARFAKKSHKKARTMAVNIGAYTVSIPARPYLGVSDKDKGLLQTRVKDWIQGAIDGD
jgi:phage gpG-like protein